MTVTAVVLVGLGCTAVALIGLSAVAAILVATAAVALTFMAVSRPMPALWVFVPIICVYYFGDTVLRYRFAVSEVTLSLLSRWQLAVLIAVGVGAYRRGARPSRNLLDLAMVAFLVWVLLYVPTAPSTASALYGVSNLVQFEVAYWAGRLAAPFVRTLPGYIVGAAIPFAIFGLLEPPLLGASFYESVSNHVPDGYFQNTGSGLPRSSSLLGSAGYFGSYLMIVIPLALARVVHGGGRSLSLTSVRWTITIVVLALGLVASFHRSSWIGAAAASVVVLVSATRRPLWGLAGAITAVGAVMLGDQVFGLSAVLDSASSLRDFSTASHVDHAQGYLHTAIDRPFGNGIGTAGNTAAFLGGASDAPGLEGGYSQVVLQLGWIGLGLFIALHLTALALLLRATLARPSDGNAWVTAGLAGGVLGVMVFDLALPFQSFNPALMVLWLVIGGAVSQQAGRFTGPLAQAPVRSEV